MSRSPQPQRTGVSPVQVIGSALAAVSAAVIASFFGVAGTIVGAAVGSIVATVGSTIYTQSLRTANERLRARVQASDAWRPRRERRRPPPPDDTAPRTSLDWLARRKWLVAGGAVGVFIAAMIVVTIVELIGGEPLSSLVGSTNDSGGTSVFGGSPSHPGHHSPTPAPSASRTTAPTPSPSASPTTTPSPEPSTTTAPTPTTPHPTLSLPLPH